jgi:hypothetical protein
MCRYCAAIRLRRRARREPQEVLGGAEQGSAGISHLQVRPVFPGALCATQLTMRRVALAVVAGVVVVAAWSWKLGRRLVTWRPGGFATPSPETRRNYVFGAIGRQAFDAAMRKTRRRGRGNRAS